VSFFVTKGSFTPDAAPQRDATQLTLFNVNTVSLFSVFVVLHDAVIKRIKQAESVHTECDALRRVAASGVNEP